MTIIQRALDILRETETELLLKINARGWHPEQQNLAKQIVKMHFSMQRGWIIKHAKVKDCEGNWIKAIDFVNFVGG